jgi:hypothetical protein
MMIVVRVLMVTTYCAVVEMGRDDVEMRVQMLDLLRAEK